MAGAEVSSVIDSILSAFQHGMDIFRKMPHRKQKQRPTTKAISEDESKVHDSLSLRPREIQTRYQQSVAKHGHQFEVGDNTCQTSLAHILLIMNTGLVRLLNRALSNDSKERSLSRRSLLSLSELAAADTLSALSELSLRLSSASQLSLRSLPSGPNPKAEANKQRTATTSSQQVKKRSSPNPALAKGGWVRVRKGSSLVSVPTTKTKKPRPGAKRSQSAPSLVGEKKEGKQGGPHQSVPKVNQVEMNASRHSQASTLQAFEITGNYLHKGEYDNLKRPPSMLVVPADFFESYQLAPVRPEVESPPRPPKVPLHSRPNVLQRRPPSMMTFRTDSTKIGEIPEHKLPDRVLTASELERIPMPYVIPLPPEPPKKKSRGFKFWKKHEVFQSVAA